MTIFVLGCVAAQMTFSHGAMAQDETSDDDLGPTTAVPWNPEKPVPRQEPWEAALRFPGRIVSLPLYPGMTDRDVQDVIDAVGEIVWQYRR